ncbi:MAG: peptidoglycan DD-metalloendopeptidase family protein [Bacteroidia bacterium]|nr:peptidoglycan DD-metalloendopeptidase family protein [Bacteroidia bacterium]
MKYKKIVSKTLATALLFSALSGCMESEPEVEVQALIPAPAITRISNQLYGFVVDYDTKIVKSSLKKNQKFIDFLRAHKISKQAIQDIMKQAVAHLDVSKLPSGNPITLLKDKEKDAVQYFIYEKSKEEYVVFDVRDSICITEYKKEIETVRREVAVEVETTILNALDDAGLNVKIAQKTAEILECAVDFFKVKRGDTFKVIYDEQVANGQSIGVSTIYAICFVHKGESHYAFRHEVDGKEYYYDENGNSLRKAFLKAPLKFSRISSGYTNSRFHPILKIYRPHQGIDYAAPSGTPILTIGDGEIIEMGYNSGNGNYIKVKHNKTYTTQYLHMSKFAKGMKKGSKVTQGEVIGYVGSTGLATGPHLCFRFWKDGEQVNPSTHISDVKAMPIPSGDKKDYLEWVSEVMEKLENARTYTGKSLASL